MSEFDQLAAKLHDLAERRKKKAPLALLLKQPEAARNDHGDDDTGCLSKALQYAHAAGALTGAEANRLDLIARQGRLPANVRDALRSINTSVGGPVPFGD
jgi:hypothetical protein